MMQTLAIENIVNGLLRFNGRDTIKFLQGQLTCDMKELSPNRALPGAFCSPQGRVRASFIIFQVEADDFLMLLPREQIPFLIDVMAPYIAFFQSSMSDVSDNWHVFGIQTIDVGDVGTPKRDMGTPNETRSNKISILPIKTWEMTSSNTIFCIRLPGDENRWHCVSNLPMKEVLAEPRLLSTTDWLIDDIKSGLVWIDEKNRDQFLPHDLSLPSLGAVSFDKGCYTGQEIVARMQYRGKPKYFLAIIETEPTECEIPDKLFQLLDNSEKLKIGRIINKRHIDNKKWLISASVKRTLLNQQHFQLSFGNETIICSIIIPNSAKESNNL